MAITIVVMLRTLVAINTVYMIFIACSADSSGSNSVKLNDAF